MLQSSVGVPVFTPLATQSSCKKSGKRGTLQEQRGLVPLHPCPREKYPFFLGEHSCWAHPAGQQVCGEDGIFQTEWTPRGELCKKYGLGACFAWALLDQFFWKLMFIYLFVYYFLVSWSFISHFRAKIQSKKIWRTKFHCCNEGNLTRHMHEISEVLAQMST